MDDKLIQRQNKLLLELAKVAIKEKELKKIRKQMETAIREIDFLLKDHDK